MVVSDSIGVLCSLKWLECCRMVAPAGSTLPSLQTLRLADSRTDRQLRRGAFPVVSYAAVEICTLSLVNSHSIFIRFSGRVYRSTWNSPSVLYISTR